MQQPGTKSVSEPAPELAAPERAVPRGVRWAPPLGVAFLILATLLLAFEIRRASIELDARDCQWNLSRIDGAKEQYSLEAGITKLFPAIDDLAPSNGTGYIKSFPVCPSGHGYTIGPIGKDPICGSGLPGHDMSVVVAVIYDPTTSLMRDGRPVPSLLHRLLIRIRKP